MLINLRIVNLKGLSQLNRTKSIYLCGSNDENQLGASFLKVDYSSSHLKISHLVTSCFNHINPGMISIQNEYIAIIGGKGSKKCEIYNKKLSKWSSIAELPEERYGASLVYEHYSNSIYLFGGMNDKKICYSVLKYSFKPGYFWETIVTKLNSELLSMAFSCVLKHEHNKILFLGGVDGEGEMDRFVEYDLLNRSAKLLPFKLAEKAKFSIFPYSICNSQDNVYIYDDRDGIHKIQLKEGFMCSIKSFYNIKI